MIQDAYLTGSSISTEEFRSKSLFIWYDYFSVPQGKHPWRTWTLQDVKRNSETETNEALESIPAYIDRCELFLVLCPLVPSVDRSELFGPSTWASRGWCRTEKLVRLLSPNSSCVVIKNSSIYETFQGPFAASYLPPGEGAFGCSEDKEKIGMILRQVMKRCLKLCLASEDFVRYRLYLNLHKIVFKGFRMQKIVSEFDLHSSPAETFLRQNFFRKVTDVDSVGYSPLCYAALEGSPELVESLIGAAADPNFQTTASNPLMNTGPGISVLGFAAWFGNSEAVSVLLAARADLHAGLLSPIDMAASGNQRETVRMLYNAGACPHTVGMGSGAAIHWASLHGFLDAASELVSLGVILSQSLHWAALHMGNAELVLHLVDAKADVNEPFRPRGFLKWALRMHKLRRCFKFSKGCRATILRLAQHSWNATPLMLSVLCGNDEVSVALIAAKARVDLQNWQRQTALDLALEVSSPYYLLQMLRDEAVKREWTNMVFAAASNRYPVSCRF
eukprot:Skav225519  [mRNA]  locus=scaffold2974:39364:40875:- [translate_table: standard]